LEDGGGSRRQGHRAEIEALKSADALIIAERGRCAKSMSPLQVGKHWVANVP